MFESLSEKLNQTFRNLIGKGKLSERNMEAALEEIRKSLLEADVNYQVVKDFLTKIQNEAIGTKVLQSVDPGQMIVKIVNDQLVELLGTSQEPLQFHHSGLSAMMMVGLQGTGKTTSAAKIARVIKAQNHKVLLVAADVVRPAAIDQLITLGQEIDVEVFADKSSVNALTVVKKALSHAKEQAYDTLLIDTAGRLHVDSELMGELVEIRDLVKPTEILLTVDAMTGQDILQVAKEFHQTLSLSGLIVTKMDGDARGGAVLSARAVTGVPVKYVGVGEKIDDIEPFYPDRMANRILGMGDIVTLVEQAQQKLDMEAAEKAAARMMNGQFNLEDMLVQLQQVSKMGSIKSILGMIPGINQLTSQISDAQAETAMKRQRAIIQSMTIEERRHPELIRSSRKYRIAAGAGVKPEEVNRLLAQFEKTKEQLRLMSRMLR